MPVGLRGVGLDSGEEFRVTEREHQVANTTRLSETGSYRQEIKLVGKSTKRTWWLVFSWFYRIDHDGETTVELGREQIACKPGRAG